MNKNVLLLDEDINNLIFSDEYVDTLRKIGFSQEFILNEQIRKQRECIDYLLDKVIELKKELHLIRGKKSK